MKRIYFGTVCSIDGCEKLAVGRGWCHKHWKRWQVHGDPLFTLNPNYGVGRSINGRGYVRLLMPGHPLASKSGYVLEHRLVAWEAGLLTDPTMVVHHRDHDKLNNSIDNLEVMSPSDHDREHVEHIAQPNREKTHCPRGHPYSGDNLLVTKNANGGPRRSCLACMKAANVRSWEKKRHS